MKYIQMSLKSFVCRFPSFPIPSFIDTNDNDYIVRICPSDGSVEFGYISDSWRIK